MKGRFWKAITWLITGDSSSDTFPFREHSWCPQVCVSCCRVCKGGPTTSFVARMSSLPASALAGAGISSALTFCFLTEVLLPSCTWELVSAETAISFPFFSIQVLAAVDLSPISLPANTSYCTGPCFMCQTGFLHIFGSILGENHAGWDAELWSDVVLCVSSVFSTT